MTRSGSKSSPSPAYTQSHDDINLSQRGKITTPMNDVASDGPEDDGCVWGLGACGAWVCGRVDGVCVRALFQHKIYANKSFTLKSIRASAQSLTTLAKIRGVPARYVAAEQGNVAKGRARWLRTMKVSSPSFLE